MYGLGICNPAGTTKMRQVSAIKCFSATTDRDKLQGRKGGILWG